MSGVGLKLFFFLSFFSCPPFSSVSSKEKDSSTFCFLGWWAGMARCDDAWAGSIKGQGGPFFFLNC